MARILVVADDSSRAADVVATLAAAGFDAELTSQIDPSPIHPGFDLVLYALTSTDIGFDFASRARTIPEYPPVIVRADRTDPADILRGLSAGAAAVVTFDLDPAELGRRLRRVLVRTGHPDPNSGPVEFRGHPYPTPDDPVRLRDELVTALEDLGRLNDRFAAELAQRW